MKLSDIPRPSRKGVSKFNDLLLPQSKSRYIGTEKEKKTNKNNIRLFISRQGSWRFVYELDGVFVSVVQIMRNPIKGTPVGTIANAYTVKDHRRKGYAKLLLKYARTIMKVSHSDDLSDDGRKFMLGTN